MLCNPMGIPILRYCHTRSQLIRKFGRANLNPNFPFHRKPSARNMLNACEMIVAYAAPRTPISNFATSSTSPAMLQRHATPTKISGATLFPKPRKIAASALYPMMNTTPQEQMEIYWIVSATASSGTCNAETSSGANNTSPAVTNTLISREKLITMPIHRLVLRLSPAPKYRPINTVAPVVSPMMKDMTRCMTSPPLETAATPILPPPNFPTTHRSTAPYIACTRFASRKGTANTSRFPVMLPRVRFFVPFIIQSPSFLKESV